MADFRLPSPQQYDWAGALGEGLSLPLKLKHLAIQNQSQQFALSQARAQQAAMQEYAKTRNLETIMPHMTPPQAAAAPGAMEHQQNVLQEDQMNLGMKAVDYWDSTKHGLTRASYGKWREDSLKQFPQLGHTLPEPGQFKTDEEFEQFKYQKEMMAAKFKAANQRPSSIPAGGSLYIPGQGIIPGQPKPHAIGSGGLLMPDNTVVPPAARPPTTKPPTGKLEFKDWYKSYNADRAKRGEEPASEAEAFPEYNRQIADPKEAAKEAHRAPAKGKPAAIETPLEYKKRTGSTEGYAEYRKAEQAKQKTAAPTGKAAPTRETTQPKIKPSLTPTAEKTIPVTHSDGTTYYVSAEEKKLIDAAGGK